MPALTSVLHLSILERQTTEADQEICILCHHGQRGRLVLDCIKFESDHVRYDDLGSCERIAVHRCRVAANSTHKAVDLTLGVVKASRTRPAIGSGVDRHIAIAATQD